MKKFTIVLFLLAFTTIAFAAPIDFDNLNVVSTTYGIIGGTLRTRLLAAYNDKIYFIVAYDGTANPSKVYCYDPSDGWSNGVNHTILAETTGIFVTLRKIDDLLYFSDDLGNVYSYDGTTLTEMSGTPFTASDYVSSIEVFNGLMYFATYTGNIFRHDGVAFEQVYDADVSEDRDIRDMVSWQKDGYLYVSVHPFPCCPPNAYVIRSNTGNLGSWGTVFSGFWAVNLFLPTADYLYAGVVDTAYSHSSTIRRSSDGTTFPVIYGPDGQYKHPYGSLYHDGIAYFFTNGGSGGFGGIIVDDNGSVSRTINQNWMITQAVELNGEVYALAADSSDALSIPADVYLITTAPEPEWSFVHITDPHVGYKYKEKKNKDKATDDLDAAIYQIVSMSTKPDFILVTGDITHYGCDENSNCHGHYNRFLESIEDAVAAGIKVYVVPGNHDWSKPDLDTDCNNGLFCYNQTINPRRPADTESLHGLNNYYFYSQYNDILFIGLDTGGYVGGLSEDQISALMGLGAVNKLIPKVVFMHHPGVDTDDWWVPFDEDFSIVDHNEEFLNWCDSNNVQLVLSGHSHQDHIYNRNGDELAPNSTDYPQYVQTPTTCSKLHWPAPPVIEGYRIIHIRDGKSYPQEYTPIRYRNSITASFFSPGNLHIYDPAGRHVGIVDGNEVERGITDSFYHSHYIVPTDDGNEVFPEKIIIFDPCDDYLYEVVGTEIGTYHLEISYGQDGNEITFEANDIPTIPGSIHDYVIDWDVLSEGQDGVTVFVDKDGDGNVDKTIISDNELTHGEFNIIPNANAGTDQTVYAWIDGIADVNLDGSDSNDPDGDELTYLWTWSIDSNTFEANGVSPTIELPAGLHTIQLVVNDGLEDSTPDYVNVNVIAPLQTNLWIYPNWIYRSSRWPRYISAVIMFPQGIGKEDVKDQPFVMYPGSIESFYQRILEWSFCRTRYTYAFAYFDKDELTDAVPDNGQVELNVVGQLQTGQYYYGTDTIFIKDWRWHWYCR